MATTLQSPGVSVSIINESFYTPAAPGTVPLIFVASASNKSNPSGVTAAGTSPANAGKVYLITSQRDLVDTFGTPLFYTDANGNPVHGGELNEYGLQAAYSLLGVSSAAYVVRAPIDLASLVAKSSAPSGAPADGSHWVDTGTSLFGIFEWSQAKSTFTSKTPIVIDDSNDTTYLSSGLPKQSVGTAGQYAIVLNTPASTATVYYKNSDNNWVVVGSVGQSFTSTETFSSTAWSTSWPVVKGTKTPATLASGGELTINGTSVLINSGALTAATTSINSALRLKGVGSKVVNGALALYADANAASDGTTPDGKIKIAEVGTQTTVLSQLGITAGTYNGSTVFVGPHTQYPDFTEVPSGSVYVKTTSPNGGASWTVKRWSATSNTFSTVAAPIYASNAAATYNLDKVGGGANIPVGTVFVESNVAHGDNFHSTSTALCRPVLADFVVKRRVAVAPTRITSTATTSVTSGTLVIKISQPGTSEYLTSDTITFSSATTLDAFVSAVNGTGLNGLSATFNEDGTINITHATGGEIKFINNGVLQSVFPVATTNNLYALGSKEPDGATHVASNWQPLSLFASASAPSSTPANGQLWYSSIVDQVDIMYHNGTTWVGYKNAFPNTDPNGPIVSSTQPTTQSDGVTALANGDIWVSTASIDRYGKDVYVYNGNTLQWVLQDVADNTSPNGWVFADARWADNGEATSPATIETLLSSNYLDPDAPDPALYPRGTRLWNLRRSGFNVKQYVTGYINLAANDGKNIRYQNEDMTLLNYSTNRWVSVSPNNADGSGTFGRFAQRAFVVSSLKALIDGNTAIRDTDTLVFNLIATPGYPEAIQNMIGLNADRAYTAFVVGDTSMRLKPTGTDLAAYGLNSNGAFDNGEDGLVSYNEYMAVFYPSGYSNDLTGKYIVVPPSHMMLRTIAQSDAKSYPWFAPAGIRRGVVDNVTSVGYIENGEFKAATLPNSIRDVMATKGKINPIATFTGAGIINFGQYTRANAASALDRINVARLVAYLRRQLDILARPFLFEPNDKITRNEIKNAVQKLLLELVGQRALYDFIVVCDESNNTPARIDRSELWVDVAIEPVKAVEFIYIPVRLVNTGAIKAGTFTLA